MDLGLTNRVALVTGASRGIGWAIAHRFALEGAKVVICARNPKQLELAAEKIRISTGSEVYSIQTDLSSPTEVTGRARGVHILDSKQQSFGPGGW